MYRRAGSLAVIIAALVCASQLPAHAEILQNTAQYVQSAVQTAVRETPEDILKLEQGRVFDAIKPAEFDERLHSDDDVKPLDVRRGIDRADGGGIPPAQHDVLVEEHGICRWIDNSGGAEYFVPTRSPEELAAFIANRPQSVDAANCCPAKVVMFEASDGQQRRFKLDIGREGASGPRGTASLLHVFNLTRSEDGATWQERVSETYRCENGAWTGNGAVRTGQAPELIVPKVCGSHLDGERWFDVTGSSSRSANASECPYGAADRALTWNVETEFRCVSGVPTATGATRTSGQAWSGSCAANPCAPKLTQVVATWSGQMRRSSRHNRTDASTGFGGVGDYYMDGNSSRTVVNFPLLVPAKNTMIKITATYDRYGHLDGRPRTTEFYIADGQTVWGGAGNTYYVSGRRGDQFSMTNTAIRMPGYDSSPNLYNMRAEYNAHIVPQVCKAECGGAAGSCASGAASNISTVCPYPVTYTYLGQTYQFCYGVPVTTWTCRAATGGATTSCRQ